MRRMILLLSDNRCDQTADEVTELITADQMNYVSVSDSFVTFHRPAAF
jgi:hypothetical protein